MDTISLQESAKIAVESEQWDRMEIKLYLNGKITPAKWEDAYMGMLVVNGKHVWQDTLEDVGVRVIKEA